MISTVTNEGEALGICASQEEILEQDRRLADNGKAQQDKGASISLRTIPGYRQSKRPHRAGSAEGTRSVSAGLSGRSCSLKPPQEIIHRANGSKFSAAVTPIVTPASVSL